MNTELASERSCRAVELLLELDSYTSASYVLQLGSDLANCNEVNPATASLGNSALVSDSECSVKVF